MRYPLKLAVTVSPMNGRGAVSIVCSPRETVASVLQRPETWCFTNAEPISSNCWPPRAATIADPVENPSAVFGEIRNPRL